MKATEFVKKYGWGDAREYLAGATIFDNHLMVFTDINDLQNLVNAYELVESYGGLASARKEAHKDCFEFNRPLLAACYLVASVDA